MMLRSQIKSTIDDDQEDLKNLHHHVAPPRSSSTLDPLLTKLQAPTSQALRPKNEDQRDYVGLYRLLSLIVPHSNITQSFRAC